MIVESIIIPAEWKVPAFDECIIAPKKSRFALIIPVINEGERIRSQLRAILAIPVKLDVIIADGGSSDGSLDLDFLKSVDVNTMLIKRGSGRLSAQLRMAYGWAMSRGYEGVVTVDGNAKDGVEALPVFLKALENGYDIVQGSRYISGGVAENTPLDRYIAGRFVHAPLISLGARFRFTDTTNGFRAYSRRALCDPRVAPFREIFSAYSLLFYLSVRIPQLGYRAIEVPVTRRYPSKGTTPTKIAGMRGRIAMMKELVDAVRGRFNP